MPDSLTAAQLFSHKRWEYGGSRLYYLPGPLRQQLERKTSTIVIGSRGSGKTTLLQSLSWRERLQNESLKACLEQGFPESGFIGLYTKASASLWRRLDNAAIQTGEVRRLVFALYLDATLLQILCRALAELEVEGELPAFEMDSAEDAVGRLLDAQPRLTNFMLEGDTPTYRGGYRALGRLLDELKSAVLLHPEGLPERLERFPTIAVGEMAAQGAELLLSALGVEAPRWSVFYCIDEAEALSEFQQLQLNTAIRTARHPLYYKVAFVSTPKTVRGTDIQGFTLQDSDRELIIRDRQSPTDFADFLDGVVSARASQATGGPCSVRLQDWLGRPSPNEVLAEVLVRKVGSGPKRVIASARARHPDAPNQLLESYLLDHQQHWLRTGKPPSRQDLEKRVGEAYLSICRESKIRTVPFAGHHMLLHLSDSCIRDALRQLEAIAQQDGGSLEALVSGRTVPVAAQARGIAEAGERKLTSLTHEAVDSPAEVGNLAEYLGQITAVLQGPTRNWSNLRVPGRGFFRCRLSEGETGVGQRVLGVLRDGDEGGILRDLEHEGDEVLFRVHRSLAAKFGFSWRLPDRHHARVILEDELDAMTRGVLDEAALRHLLDRVDRAGDAQESTAETSTELELPLGRDDV
ncbi:MAG: hypothetical protein EP330_08545 [Deltaproteobacteria bacterium]|nr:MAG: hypothetical protein EP330_08545 [Deltaproteobacteria bacterium]